MRASHLAIALVAMTAALAPQTATAAPGDLDPSWDTDGIRDDSGGSDPDVAVAPDGKVVVSTGFTDELFRYNADGTPDTSFDGDGRVASPERINALAVQSDGKIVVVGESGGDFWFARFNTNGSLDMSFDGDGEQTVDFGGQEQANAVVIQSGGRILAAGTMDDSEYALARLTSAGAPDTSFDTDGRQTVDFGGATERGQGVAVQSNGRIIVTGLSAGDFATAGLTDSGGLDGGFGAGGKVTTDFGQFDTANAVAIDSSNRVVVVGDTGADFFAIARYTATGSLDSSCDTDGTLTVDFGETFQVANDVAMQFNDKFVVAGTIDDDFAIARLLPANCALDTGFAGGDGKFTVDGNGNGFDSVAIQPADGKILASGSSAGEPGDIITMRLQGDEPPPPPEPEPEPEPEPQPQPQPNPCANDTAGPVVSIRSLQDRTLYRQNQSPASVRIEASDSSGLAADPSNPARGIATSTPGVFTVTATARDNCGNETTTVFTYRVAAAPAIRVAGVTGSCRTSNFRVTIRARGDVSITRLTARLRGRLLGSANGSRLTVQIPIRSLRPGGRYVLTLAARDRAGNLSTDRVDFARCVVVRPTFTG
jgi:uncharacterized delta-60 repeat protein